MRMTYYALVAAIVLCPSVAMAGLFKASADFRYGSFLAFSGVSLTPAPTDPVVGSVVFTFDSITGAGRVDEISLNIDGHQYAPSEVTADVTIHGSDISTADILVNVESLYAVTPGIDAFNLGFVLQGMHDEGMGYSVASNNTTWWSTTEGNIEPFGFVPIPEPGSLALIGVGLAAALIARRHRSQASAGRASLNDAR